MYTILLLFVLLIAININNQKIQRVHILCHHDVKRVNETKILGYQSHLFSMNQFTVN